MATSKKAKSRAQPIAIELLEADHRKVAGLFAEYEDEKEGEEDAKRAIAQRICGELSAHAQLEEELFYPWLRETLSDEDVEMVEEAEVEHATARDLIAQLEAGGEIDAAYDAKVKVLSEYIKHHVKEEEDEIFPKVSDQAEALDELGQEMAARQAELREELGLVDDAQVPAPPRKAPKGEQRKAR